jgi:hypothetical protein
MFKAAGHKVAQNTLISSDVGRFVRRNLFASLAMTVCIGLPVVVYYTAWSNAGSVQNSNVSMKSVDDTHQQFADKTKSRCIPRKPCPEKDKTQP